MQKKFEGFEYAELMNMAMDREQKFEYAFASLIFVMLGFSIQFVGNIGIHAPWLAVIGWLALLVSSYSTGWRLIHSPVYLKMNADINRKIAIQASPEEVAVMRLIFDKKAEKYKVYWNIRHYSFMIAIFSFTIFSVLNFMVKAKILEESFLS